MATTYKTEAKQKQNRSKKTGQYIKNNKSNILLFIVVIAIFSFIGYVILHTSTSTPTQYTAEQDTRDNIQKLTDNIAQELRELQQAELTEAEKELQYKEAKLYRLKKEINLQEAEQAYYTYQGKI